MEPEQEEKLHITRGELAAFLLQSVMLAAAMAFSAAIVFQRNVGMSRASASGIGLEEVNQRSASSLARTALRDRESRYPEMQKYSFLRATGCQT